MIWIDIRKLENKISANELSDKDGFNYVLAYFILVAIVLAIISNDSSALVKLLGSILSVIITIWGLNATYQANNEIDGKDFFKRYFAISWVIGMRLIIVMLVLSIISGLVIVIISTKNGSDYLKTNPVNELVSLIFTSVFSIICYLLIINSFRRIKPKAE
jgi:hypothetical protein